VSDSLSVVEYLLARTPDRNTTEHNLALAQIHATLAVEQAVRDLIEKIGASDA
jgi:hypothetical protein